MDAEEYFSHQRLMASKIPDDSVLSEVNRAIDIEERKYRRQSKIVLGRVVSVSRYRRGL